MPRPALLSTGQSVCSFCALLMRPCSYRAPELFEVPSSATITASSDVWSLGCCIYATAFGHSPFDGSALAAMSGRLSFPTQQSAFSDPSAARNMHAVLSLYSAYTEELCECVRWVLQVEPSDRPSVIQVQDRLASLLPTMHSEP